MVDRQVGIGGLKSEIDDRSVIDELAIDDGDRRPRIGALVAIPESLARRTTPAGADRSAV